MYFPIRRSLSARPEPDNTFWDDSTNNGCEKLNRGAVCYDFNRHESVVRLRTISAVSKIEFALQHSRFFQEE